MFFSALEEVGEAAVLVSTSGKIDWMNRSALNHFSQKNDALTGVEAASLFFEKPDKPFTPELKLFGSGDIRRYQFGRIRHANRGSVPAAIKVIYFQDKKAGCLLLFHLHEDENAETFNDSLKVLFDEIRQQLINKSSPDYVSLLRVLGQAIEADRIYVFVYPDAQKKNFDERQMVEWVREESKTSIPSMHNDSGRFSSWWKDRVLSGEIISFSDLSLFPDIAASDKKIFKKAGVKSLFVYPFQSKESSCAGFIGLDWIRKSNKLSDSERSMLTMILETFSAHLIRKKAEERLRISESRFRTLIQNSTDILMVLSPGNQLLFVSPSAKKTLGYEPEELVGISIFDYIHEEDKESVKTTLSGVLEGRQEDLVAEHRFLHKDGHWVFLESVGSSLVKESIVGGMVINARDVTDRKRVEEELIRARDSAEEMNRVKTALLANMSHEMRTPLTGILGFAGILESDLPEGEGRDMATRIYISGRRLLETIESILDLAKLESEEIEIQMENVNIINEILRAMDAHQRSATQKRITFELQTDLKELYLDLDRHLFSRVMFNLLSNAFKYTAKGEVIIQVSRFIKKEKEWVQVDVQDTGIGISPDFLPKVFEEFQQESTGLARKFEGSGLGLTITRKLVEAMDGSITANSKKGDGSIFTVQLPIVNQAVKGAKQIRAVRVPPKLKRKKPKILVVEDDFDSSVIAKFYLGKDYEVETVESGERSLDRLKEDTFQMVILDISLGAGMDGIATLKTIRANMLWANMPVIALTAHALGGDEEYYISQGFSGYLAKPFKRDELLDLVSMLLKQ